jgi:hypothetical protein
VCDAALGFQMSDLVLLCNRASSWEEKICTAAAGATLRGVIRLQLSLVLLYNILMELKLGAFPEAG